MVTDQNDRSVLLSAAEGGNVQVVRMILDNGANVNGQSRFGQTAMVGAAMWGSVELVQLLLDHGADVNKTSCFGQTALFTAAEGGNVAVVKLLLGHGANVKIISELGETVLFAAAAGGCVEVVQLLLSHGVDINVRNNQDKTALFPAVQNGHIEILKILLKQGLNAHDVDNTGYPLVFHTANLIGTPLSSDAVIDIVNLVLSHGASADTKNASGETLLLHYLSHSRMKKDYRGKTLDTLQTLCHFLTDREVDVNERTYCGYSAIHLVLLLLGVIFISEMSVPISQQSVGGLLNLIFVILSNPSCSNSIGGSKDDIDGNTPLHLWASLTHLLNQDMTDCPNTTCMGPGFTLDASLCKIATQLLSCGAEVNVTNGKGETPLHQACAWNTVKFLLDKGALVNATDIHGNTPLLRHFQLTTWRSHSFSEFRQSLYDNMKVEPVKMQWKEILGTGMDPWKGNDEGATVLSLLLQANFFAVTQAFLEATGVPYDQSYPMDSNGDTPLHVICRDSGEENLWKLNLIDLLTTSAGHIVNQLNRKGETALHIVCHGKKIDQLSIMMIQRLRAYGAKIDIPDGEGKTCLEIVADKPELRNVLIHDVNRSQIDPLLPWSSKSEKHRKLLDEVVRNQKTQQTRSFYYHTDPIGSGAFGHVYAGICSKDGREVAVKRIERVRMRRPEDRKEISHLVHLTGCKHVVHYFACHKDNDFLYIVLELMEGTLKELLDGPVKEERLLLVSLCTDVLKGVVFLHQNDIIHRDIKPDNILYNKCNNSKFCLKLADFGLSVKAANTSTDTTTVMHSKAGSRCWMAPEVLRGTAENSKASDVFACGLVLHYILSRKRHPFGPENESGKSVFVVQNETEANIKNNLMIDGSLSPESSDLVKWMVNDNTIDRAIAVGALRHPLVWSNHKKCKFLVAVGDQLEVKQPRIKAHYHSEVEKDIESSLGHQFSTTESSWNEEVPAIFAEMTLMKKFAKYETSSAVDLLRFIRNTNAHITDLTEEAQGSVLQDWVFLVKFPTLLMDVYKAVTRHEWEKREPIASVMAEYD